VEIAGFKERWFVVDSAIDLLNLLHFISSHICQLFLYNTVTNTMLSSWVRCLGALLLLASVAQAQFQFFEHMFGGHQEHHQQNTQNSASDSARYQQLWEGSELSHRISPLDQKTVDKIANAPLISQLQQIPLSGDARMR
jgi:hypothetical protein